MIEQAITIDHDEILILAQFFIHKDFSVTNRDMIMDVLGKYYNGHILRVRGWDGENFEFSGFYDFLRFLSTKFNIPKEKIIIETHDVDEDNGFTNDVLKLGIFVTVKQYLTDISKNLSDAKFVGCLLGRYNINRLRLAYELDQAFTNDTFITYQPKIDFINHHVRHFDSLYKQELDWLANKKFDVDLTSTHHMGMIDWQTSCANYANIWNKYHIEVISETDSIGDFWFTEKTANCLATGKPFVLMSGQNSLARLRKMGFKTFDSVLDESYDNALHPYDRIRRLTQTLKRLYNSPSRAQQISKLYKIADQNIDLYQKFASGKKI